MKHHPPPLSAPAALVLGLALSLAACVGPPPAPFDFDLRFAPVQKLHPGDTVRIAFPATPGLDSTQQIRRDGNLNLPEIGEIKAADRTPAELQKALRQAYSSQLLSSDVNVTVVTAPFTIFVSGAVQRPGKISPDRTITVLEAVMEAGGFDQAKANPRAVIVIRTDAQQTRRVTLDLQAVLDGREPQPFYLESYDIVYVPERFSWF